MQMPQLHDLFVMELQDLYDAEKQLLEVLPKMAKAAVSPDLKAGFEEHLQQTQEHVARLEQIAEELGFSCKGKTCKGMKGLIEEGSEIISGMEPSEIRDLALIGAAQKVEHYEISGYGTARTHAEMMTHDDAADLLQTTLDEESETDDTLTETADVILSEMEEQDE